MCKCKPWFFFQTIRISECLFFLSGSSSNNAVGYEKHHHKQLGWNESSGIKLRHRNKNHLCRSWKMFLFLFYFCILAQISLTSTSALSRPSDLVTRIRSDLCDGLLMKPQSWCIPRVSQPKNQLLLSEVCKIKDECVDVKVENETGCAPKLFLNHLSTN